MKKYIFLALFFIPFLFLPGCGGERLPEVTGRVTLKGQDFQNIHSGNVTFVPENGKPFYGTIQPDGTFRMKGADNRFGVRPGEYRVAVMVQSAEEVRATPLASAVRKLLSPSKYADIKTSGLTQTVPAGGVKDLIINLE